MDQDIIIGEYFNEELEFVLFPEILKRAFFGLFAHWDILFDFIDCFDEETFHCSAPFYKPVIEHD